MSRALPQRPASLSCYPGRSRATIRGPESQGNGVSGRPFGRPEPALSLPKGQALDPGSPFGRPGRQFWFSRLVFPGRRIGAAGKGVIGMKILGEGVLRDRVGEALQHALALDCIDCFTIGAEDRYELADLVQRIPEASTLGWHA